jgi:hypothetical protein
VSVLTTSVQAAVQSTVFTVSLSDIDYFLPPKSVASLSSDECLDTLKVALKDGPFLPFTVLAGDDIASITSSYSEDDVWQEEFLEGTYLPPC